MRLYEKIKEAYDSRSQDFIGTDNFYVTNLFSKKLDKWKNAQIGIMQDWIKTHEQAVSRRRESEFGIDDYFRFNRVGLAEPDN